MDAITRTPNAPRWEPANPRSPAREARGRRGSGGSELADGRRSSGPTIARATTRKQAPPRCTPPGARPSLTTQRRPRWQSAEQFALGYAWRPLRSRSCKLTGQPVHAAELHMWGTSCRPGPWPLPAPDRGRRPPPLALRAMGWRAGTAPVSRPSSGHRLSAHAVSVNTRHAVSVNTRRGYRWAQSQCRTLGGSGHSLRPRCPTRQMRQMRPPQRIKVQPLRPEVIRYRSAPQSAFSEALPEP